MVHPLVAMVFTAQLVTASYKAQSLVNNEWTATLLRKEKHTCAVTSDMFSECHLRKGWHIKFFMDMLHSHL